MRILLDTHIFLWFISNDPRLPPNMRDIIRDSDNEVYLSSVSIWEVIVKYQLGKLPLL
jgi:PIN domain nuclease of toxin-antitoxin system